jgi:hypothetical protein
MNRNPILDLPLGQVMRPEIALPLRHVLHIQTVGGFLRAWNSPRKQRQMEQVFDTPEQARQAAAVCAAWLGVPSNVIHKHAGPWWQEDQRPTMQA